VGDRYHDFAFSYLPGQKLSRCSCPGEDHPGPKHDDGTFVGRSAPEIDIFEATTEGPNGAVSQSGQWAPFNADYQWFNTTDNLIIPDPTITVLNSYAGGSVSFCSRKPKTRAVVADLIWFIRLVHTSKPFLRFPIPVSRSCNNLPLQ